MRIARSIQSKIKDGYRLLKTTESSEANVKTVNPIGFDSRPVKNVKYVILNLYRAIVSIGGIQKPISDLDEGEVCTYSQEKKGGVSATIKHRNDGTLELNGNEDYAVKYNELKTAFNELQTQFNTLVSLYNAHTHPVPFAQAISAVVIPPSSPTTTLGSPSTGDITASKAPTVKLP